MVLMCNVYVCIPTRSVGTRGKDIESLKNNGFQIIELKG